LDQLFVVQGLVGNTSWPALLLGPYRPSWTIFFALMLFFFSFTPTNIFWTEKTLDVLVFSWFQIKFLTGSRKVRSLPDFFCKIQHGLSWAWFNNNGLKWWPGHSLVTIVVRPNTGSTQEKTWVTGREVNSSRMNIFFKRMKTKSLWPENFF
jgi:hypothetical protein